MDGPAERPWAPHGTVELSIAMRLPSLTTILALGARRGRAAGRPHVVRRVRPGADSRDRGWSRERRLALLLLPIVAAASLVAGIAVATSRPDTGPRADRFPASRAQPHRVVRRPAVPSQPSFPIRAAFYYGWYPENWTIGGRRPHFHPSAGYYSSSDLAVQRAQIEALVYARMDAAISSWQEPGSPLDTRLRGLLAETVRMGAPLKWAIYDEQEGRSDPTPTEIAGDLSYIRDHLATSSAYLRVGHRFVVFVYNADDRSCDVVRRWRAANARLGRPAYLVLKIFPGYGACRLQPDAWHEYAPAYPAEQQGRDAYEISPGFWKATETVPRLRRSVGRFRSDIHAMVRSQAGWQLVTTFNEWLEGTAVESGWEWATRSGEGAYLDALHAGLPRRGR
jgi:hypothetical protein